MVCIAHVPAPAEPPVKKKRVVDYSRLVLSNGRLTRAYWLLREGFTQDVRQDWIHRGSIPKDGFYCWRTSRYILALERRGYLHRVKGPRGGKGVFRTTEEGAFAMLLAEGQHEAKKQAPAAKGTPGRDERR